MKRDCATCGLDIAAGDAIRETIVHVRGLAARLRALGLEAPFSFHADEDGQVYFRFGGGDRG